MVVDLESKNNLSKSHKDHSHSADVVAALRASSPVLCGYVFLGMVFGYLFRNSGAPWFYAPLMSLFVYAGAAQFAAVSMIAARMPIYEISLAILAINLRHVFYGLSFLDRLPSAFLQKLYFIFGLTDETYSILTSAAPAVAETQRFRMSVTVLNHVYWLLGSLLGSILVISTPDQLKGLEFVLTALFVVLAIEQWISTKNKLPFLLAGLFGTVATLLFPKSLLFTSITMTVMALLAMYVFERKRHARL